MPAEQAAGRIDEVDERSDVYSVGAMLYHLLAERAPYQGDESSSTAQQVLEAVLDGEPDQLGRVAPTVDAELAAICARAMARDRERRYACRQKSARASLTSCATSTLNMRTTSADSSRLSNEWKTV